MIDTTAEHFVEDAGIAEFIDMARSANVFFEIINDRLTVRAVNPNWKMWAPIRHLLDEIGIKQVEDHMRRAASNTRCTMRSQHSRPVAQRIAPRPYEAGAGLNGSPGR